MMFGLQMINEMEKMHREMDQLFSHLGLSGDQDLRVDTAEVKLSKTEDGYQLVAMLPGLDVDKLEIDVLGRRLTLAAEPAVADAADDVIWHRRERRRSSFQRSLTLPAEIDTERVEAEYRQGILTVRLPKAPSALPKKIRIKASE